jgi:hypothetical protein
MTMFKVILTLLVVLAAALYFPASRAVVLEYAAPLLNPALRLATKAEMEKISRDVQTYERETTRLPNPNEFAGWLEGRYAGDVTRDSWGNTYILVIRPRSFDIVSMGPDGQLNTDDDVLETRNRR